MDNSKIKKYAPQARTDFRKAVASRLALSGITNEGGDLHIEQLQRDGTSIVIGGRAYARSVGEKRERLEQAVKKDGYEQTVERLAYTWFNRLVAIRYMELHGYLDHGYRVLSHPEGEPLPEILEHAEHVDLPGLSKSKVVELKIDGNKDEELYRLLLVAQCNALHSAMPFLFERADDETELVLPDNLLNTDSVIRKLVAGIDEAAWEEVEVIGWLYEAYISERYQAVIGKVVASEDIPAATQRFTPKWIVRYLVQNTLGRTWLATYPDSPLRHQMKYYIEPAEQTPEVQAQLKAISPASLNPEEIRFLDPACGSGHILVEAYDLYKAIYQERGYQAKEIPSLILQKNLFGLEIDDRAAQLASFALLMKARADDPSLLSGPQKPRPHVIAFLETEGLDAREITEHLNAPVLEVDLPPTGKLFDDPGTLFTSDRMATPGTIQTQDVLSLLDVFRNSKTIGSLTNIPKPLAANLSLLHRRADLVASRGELLPRLSAVAILKLLQQARLLTQSFDCVATNPPYMATKYFPPILKAFVGDEYADAKDNLFAAFISRSLSLGGPAARVSLVTMHTWMFTSSYEDFRNSLLASATIESMLHLGARSFSSIGGAVVQTTAFSLNRVNLATYQGTFFRLLEGEEDDKRVAFERGVNKHQNVPQHRFHEVTRSPIAYWISDAVRQTFTLPLSLGEVASPRQGLATSDNNRFLRRWHEVNISRVSLCCASREEAARSRCKWFPYNKGGEFRKWYGNNEFLINWEFDGKEVISYATSLYKSASRTIKNQQYYFQPCITWNDITASNFSARLCREGFVFDVKGSSAFPPEKLRLSILAFLCSKIVPIYMSFLNPTTTFQVGDMAVIPFSDSEVFAETLGKLAAQAVELARQDWDDQETSWDFGHQPLVVSESASTLKESIEATQKAVGNRRNILAETETRVNEEILKEFKLGDLVDPHVDPNEVASPLTEPDEHIRRLISYAIGCMMGRYSLDKPGLIYAHAGNADFDASQYATFRADDDGILPLTETDWGLPDDVAKRFEEFVSVAWPKETLEENLSFVAESLEPKKGETARETIRRYLATVFYKHHLQMYKRRPIYWMFTSGKLRAFQCVVYLHRYHEGTLARMRTEYVIKLQGRIGGRIQQLEEDLAKPSTTTAQAKKLKKKLDDLRKEEKELRAFDERLKHYADKRIVLDLDDGVKVNYGKFGDLLADVKAVTGGKDEE